jgi:hypothetical protein
MSFLFAFCCKSVIEAGMLDENYLICWALFAIADALWARVLLGRK